VGTRLQPAHESVNRGRASSATRGRRLVSIWVVNMTLPPPLTRLCCPFAYPERTPIIRGLHAEPAWECWYDVCSVVAGHSGEKRLKSTAAAGGPRAIFSCGASGAYGINEFDAIARCPTPSNQSEKRATESVSAFQGLFRVQAFRHGTQELFMLPTGVRMGCVF